MLCTVTSSSATHCVRRSASLLMCSTATGLGCCIPAIPQRPSSACPWSAPVPSTPAPTSWTWPCRWSRITPRTAAWRWPLTARWACGPGCEHPVSGQTAERFGVQAQMFMAIRPAADKPWLFGIHQCSHARVWTPEEQRLFREIGRRIADGLGILLMLRDLREGEALLNETARIGRIGGWEIDTATGKAVWTEELYRIVEIDAAPPPGLDQHLNYYTPEYRPIIDQAVQRLIADGVPMDVEAEVITAKGNPIWCRVVGHAVVQEGRCVKIAGIVQDITRQKQIESEVLRLNRDLEQRGEGAHGRTRSR